VPQITHEALQMLRDDSSLDQIAAFRIVSIAIAVPAMVGELGMCLWLLIKGAPEPDLGPRPAPQVA
jgi:hypothetical protein